MSNCCHRMTRFITNLCCARAQNSSKIRRGPISPKRNDRERGENAKRKSGVRGGRRRHTESTREDRPGPPPAPTSHVMTPCGYFAREPNRKHRAHTGRPILIATQSFFVYVRFPLVPKSKTDFSPANRPEGRGYHFTFF